MTKKLLPFSLPAKIYRTLSKYAPLRSIMHVAIRSLIPKYKKIPEGVLMLNQRDVGVSGTLAFGLYEKTELELFRKSLKPGMIVVDIGANIGLYTIVAARLVGETGKVFSYEPEETNFSILKKNIALNNLSNVIPLQMGLSDRQGSSTFYLDADNAGLHSLAHIHSGGKTTTITIDTLDHSLQSYGSPRVDIIKIDVEGAEGLALKGMMGTIARSQNIKIFTEFYPEAINNVSGQASEFLEGLASAGLSLSAINENSGRLEAIIDPTNFSSNFPKKDKYVNIYATS